MELIACVEVNVVPKLILLPDHDISGISVSEPAILIFLLLTLKVGEYYDPLLGITIEDNLDEIEIKWFPQILDTSSPGVKIISYVVSDGRGNYTTFDREITVELVQEPLDITRYLPVILITCLGLGAGFYFYKQLR